MEESKVISVVDYVDIRCGHRVEKRSVRWLARETGHSRNTIKKYVGLEVPVPRYRRTQEEEAPVLGPFKPIINAMILEDLKKKPRERRTSHVIFKDLEREQGFTGAEPTVRKYFCARRRELLGVYRAFAPPDHPPCGEAQMDWVEDVAVILEGEECVVQVFALRRVNQ